MRLITKECEPPQKNLTVSWVGGMLKLFVFDEEGKAIWKDEGELRHEELCFDSTENHEVLCKLPQSELWER